MASGLWPREALTVSLRYDHVVLRRDDGCCRVESHEVVDSLSCESILRTGNCLIFTFSHVK